MSHDRALSALADRTRRTLFEHVARCPASVSELTEVVSVSQPAVSQHLKVLKDAGLVTMERNGTRHIYRADPEGLRALRRYIEGFWDDVLTAFQEGA